MTPDRERPIRDAVNLTASGAEPSGIGLEDDGPRGLQEPVRWEAPVEVVNSVAAHRLVEVDDPPMEPGALLIQAVESLARRHLPLEADLARDIENQGQIGRQAAGGRLQRRLGRAPAHVARAADHPRRPGDGVVEDPQVGAARGDPESSDPERVAAAVARQYERWGALIDRTLRQEDVSPALAEGAEGGRRAHREWIAAAFAAALAALPPARRRRLRAQLVAVCGVELWHVLRRDEGLSVAAARAAVADLITACLATHTTPEP